MANKTTTSYKMVRIPKDVWETWFKRKNKIQERIKATTNKNKKVSLTNVLRYYGNRKVDIWDSELINFFGKKKKGRINFEGTLL